jgi:hypothetical protein
MERTQAFQGFLITASGEPRYHFGFDGKRIVEEGGQNRLGVVRPGCMRRRKVLKLCQRPVFSTGSVSLAFSAESGGSVIPGLGS